MELTTVATTPDPVDRKRSKSSAFRALLTPKSRVAYPLKVGPSRPVQDDQSENLSSTSAYVIDELVFPPDHPCNNNKVLGEIRNTQNDSSPRKGLTSADWLFKSPLKSSMTHSEPQDKAFPPGESNSRAKLQSLPPTDKENVTPSSSTTPASTSFDWPEVSAEPMGLGWFAKDSVSNSRGHDYNKTSASALKRTETFAPSEQDSPSKSHSLLTNTPSRLSPIKTENFHTELCDQNNRGGWRTSSRGVNSSLQSERPVKSQRREQHTRSETHDLNLALEAVLEARNISENLRKHVRGLDDKIKADLIKQSRAGQMRQDQQKPSGSLTGSEQSKSPSIDERQKGVQKGKDPGEVDKINTPSKQERSRSRTRLFGKSDRSASKRPRSLSRPRSLMSLKNPSSSSLHSVSLDGSKDSKEQVPASLALPGDFVAYLRDVPQPQAVEVGKLHKLRILTRNETIVWIDDFISLGGMTELLGLLERIMSIEWR